TGTETVTSTSSLTIADVEQSKALAILDDFFIDLKKMNSTDSSVEDQIVFKKDIRLALVPLRKKKPRKTSSQINEESETIKESLASNEHQTSEEYEESEDSETDPIQIETMDPSLQEGSTTYSTDSTISKEERNTRKIRRLIELDISETSDVSSTSNTSPDAGSTLASSSTVVEIITSASSSLSSTEPSSTTPSSTTPSSTTP
ncbi:hypothetical protein BB560_005355, partial [Smittium megazygosporum]